MIPPCPRPAQKTYVIRSLIWAAHSMQLFAVAPMSLILRHKPRLHHPQHATALALAGLRFVRVSRPLSSPSWFSSRYPTRTDGTSCISSDSPTTMSLGREEGRTMVPKRTARARPFDDAPSHLCRPLGGSKRDTGALWSIRRSCPRSATSDGWCGGERMPYPASLYVLAYTELYVTSSASYMASSTDWATGDVAKLRC